MKDYSKGKIYIIRNNCNNLVYIGSTTQTLSKRMVGHRSIVNCSDNPLYVAMRELKVKNFYIELLENCSCSNQEELRKREGEFIRQYKSNIEGYNVIIAGRNIKEWYNDNKELVLSKSKEYRSKYPEKRKKIEKKYRDSHKELVSQNRKLYHEKNKEHRNEKIICECGKTIYRRHKNRHLKTKYHNSV